MLVKLKAKRIEKGFNQEELAKRINMSLSTYSVKENQKREFSMNECIAIMKILDCKFEDIFLQ